MSAADTTSHAAILKTLYPQTEIERLMYEHAPMLALVPKRTDFRGANLVLALRFAHTAGRSATFANAKANKAPSKLGKFTITRSKDYSLYSVDGETIEAAGDDKGAIVDALQLEVDGALDAFKRSTAIGIYRNGGGGLGTIASGQGTATITLSDVNTVVNFEVGDVVNLASDDGYNNGGSLAGVRSGSAVLTNVDRTNGTLTTSANWTTLIPGASASDTIFKDGDYSVKIRGLDAWIPSSNPGSTAFFGLDRSQDPLRLGGIRTTQTGIAPEEQLLKGLQIAYRNGAKISHFMMNDADWVNLVLSLGTRVLLSEEVIKVGDAEIGFETVTVAGPTGKVKVYADPQCFASVAYGLQMDTWSLRSAGEWPMFKSKDGLRMLREDAADAYEGRIVGYFQLCNDAPGWNIRVAL